MWSSHDEKGELPVIDCASVLVKRLQWKICAFTKKMPMICNTYDDDAWSSFCSDIASSAMLKERIAMLIYHVSSLIFHRHSLMQVFYISSVSICASQETYTYLSIK